MAEQSDLILDGEVCQICGIYLGQGDGYPRTCTTCGGDFDNDTDDSEEENDVKK